MPLRLLHTADVHIGISFSQYPDAVRERLIDERFQVLERMVAAANARNAHFFVVAGDLFDKLTVTVGDIRRTVEILKGFEGEGALVLAGNHDYSEGPENRLWRAFRAAAEGTNVVALTEARALDYSVEDMLVRWYACPCPSKYGAEPVTGWVRDESKEPGRIHIGIAHGNVEGLGLDADQRYFNMTESGLRSAGVHTWLLGHIHVPAPESGTTGLPAFFMPGTPTPDSVKCAHSGHAWWIELGPDGECTHELLATGEVRFTRLRRTLDHMQDIDELQHQCAALNASRTVLDLQLTGRLRSEELGRLATLVNDLKGRFLHLTCDQDISQVLTAEAIAARFPDGTLPHALLTGLLAGEDHPGDAQVALDLIEAIQ